MHPDAKRPCFPTLCGRFAPRALTNTVQATPSTVDTHITRAAPNPSGNGMPTHVQEDIVAALTTLVNTQLDAIRRELTIRLDQLEAKVDQVQQQLVGMVPTLAPPSTTRTTRNAEEKEDDDDDVVHEDNCRRRTTTTTTTTTRD